jgi:hypothetical protein
MYIAETCKAQLILIAVLFSFYKCCTWQKFIIYCIKRSPCSKFINAAMILWDIKIIFFLICLWQYIESVRKVINYVQIF